MSPFPSPAVAQSPNYKFTRKKPLPSISSKSSASHISNPLYEELVNYLVEQVVSLLIYKYKFEKNLSKQLGFISFPVTETLMDLFLGFKKVKGSRICLSSKIDWSCLLRRLEEAEWARQLSRQASQHDSASQRSSHHGTAHRRAPHHRAPQSSTESPSTLLEPATQGDQSEATESSLNSELPDSQLLPAREGTTAEEREPASQQEPKPAVFSGTDMGSHQYQEVVDADSQSDEEEDEDDDFLGDSGTSQSSPEPRAEVEVSHPTNGPSDPL